MSLGRKIAVQFLGLGFGLLVGCYVILELAVFPAFEDFENEWSAQNLRRIDAALESDLQALAVLDKEYAHWDDTYEFVREQNDEYAEENLDVSYWYGIGVNLVLVFDIEGDLLWGAFIDSSDGSHEPVDEQLRSTLVAGHPLVTRDSISEGITGVLQTEVGPIMVASYPITRSDFSGPAVGSFVVGQFLDAERLNEIARRVAVELSLFSADDEDMPEEARTTMRLLIRSGKTVHWDHRDDVVLGHKLLFDVTGTPIALMEVSTPRRITRIGTKTVNVAMTFLVVATAVFLLVSLIFLQRLIVEPVRRLVRYTQKIAEGDLTVNVVSGTRDEFGQLAKTFNSMTGSLRGMVTSVRETFSGLESVAGDATTLSVELSGGSDAQAEAVGNVFRSIEEMNLTIKGVAKKVEGMSLAAEENSSSVLEIGSSIDEVAKNADSLSNAVEQTSSSSNQMNSSIQGVAKNVVELSSIISGLTSSIVETDQSIKEVEKRAEDASKMSDIVTESVANEGVESVRKAVSGITEIKEIVDTSGTVIMSLAAQTEDIGKIVGLIDGVNEQASLLALNAAIIAAQAGEQGRGFSVVANEMRELSEKTADSTKEIAGLISSVQAESRNAVGVAEKGARMADEGVRLIHGVQSMLEGVRENTERSSNASRAIVSTASEQAIEIKHVMEIARKMSEMFHDIAAAATEQSVGSGQILQATEEMRNLASGVTKATAEQSSGINSIGHASERTQEMAESILEATREEARASELIVSNIQNIRSISDSNADALKSLDRMVHMLSGRVRQLKDEIDRFKVEPGASVPRHGEVEGANGAGQGAE